MTEPLTLDRHARAWEDMHPHIETLARFAAAAPVVVEFGVRTGVSTWALLAGLPSYGTLVSVDIAEVDVPEPVHSDPRWTFIQGDSLDAGGLLPARIDLAFVDTSHEYHQTLAELELLAGHDPRTILLHDWNLPDVADAVRGFCDRHGWRITLIEPSRWGLVGIGR